MVEWEEDEERNAFDIYLVVLLFKRCFHFCYLKEVVKPNENLFLLAIREI